MSIRKQEYYSQFLSQYKKNFWKFIKNNYRKCHEFSRLYGFIYFPIVTDSKKIRKSKRREEIQMKERVKNKNGITLIALVITIVLNCSYLAMDQMNKIEKI